MKPQPRTKRKKPATINLSKMTCAELAKWLHKPAVEPEDRKCKNLRNRYAISGRLKLLSLCGKLSASKHYQYCMTARHLSKIPTIKMEVAGGRPDQTTMPRFSASLKRIADENGITIHRWGKGAFILRHPLKEAPSAREE